MRDAVIIDAVRTPVGRHGGALAAVRPDDLAAIPLKAILERTGVEAAAVEDVILGCANQAGEDNRNVARMALLLAEYPIEVAGQTVNRLCGSGLQAVSTACHAAVLDEGDIFVAGGVESMSRAPWVMMKPDIGYARGTPETADTLLGWRLVNERFPDHWTVGLGVTAENVADDLGITREAQDAFALRSQERAAAAMEAGRFDDELVPVSVPQRRGDPVVVDTDEHPRPNTTLDKLAALPPVFKDGGSVTAGNASGLNDGSAAVLVMSGPEAERRELRPLARYITTAVAGVEPHSMGLGPIPATRKALDRAGMDVGDLDLVELNEAFASQSIACIDELGLDPERVNVNGGAIALGHPLGCSGARILTTLVHELRRRGGGIGLATMCIGVGQGIATLVEVDTA